MTIGGRQAGSIRIVRESFMAEENYYKKYEPFFGKWRVSRKLGEGAFGKVFEIYWDDEFGRQNKSALKMIHIPTEAGLRQQHDLR